MGNQEKHFRFTIMNQKEDEMMNILGKNSLYLTKMRLVS